MHVPDAELAVLRVLWDHGTTTIRRITDTLYPDGGTAAYATVQKLLERLESRGCVVRKRDGRVNVYAASVERGDLLRDRLRDAVDKLCEGSWTPLLTELVHAEGVGPEDLSALRELVDRLDAEHGRKREP